MQQYDCQAMADVLWIFYWNIFYLNNRVFFCCCCYRLLSANNIRRQTHFLPLNGSSCLLFRAFLFAQMLAIFRTWRAHTLLQLKACVCLFVCMRYRWPCTNAWTSIFYVLFLTVWFVWLAAPCLFIYFFFFVIFCNFLYFIVLFLYTHAARCTRIIV